MSPIGFIVLVVVSVAEINSLEVFTEVANIPTPASCISIHLNAAWSSENIDPSVSSSPCMAVVKIFLSKNRPPPRPTFTLVLSEASVKAG